MRRHPFIVFWCLLSLILGGTALMWVCLCHSAVLFNLYHPPFSIIKFTDVHAGYPYNQQAGVESCSNSMQNAINAIIAHKSDWNVKLVEFPGDVYQDNTNSTDYQYLGNPLDPQGGVPDSYQAVTNYMNQLRAAGISVYVVPGNHDCDDPGSQLFWTNMFPDSFWTSDPMFYTFVTNGTWHLPFFKTTISGFNLAVIGYPWVGNNPTGQVSVAAVEAAYQPWTALICSNMEAFPNYHFEVGAHFFLNENGLLTTSDDPVLYPYIGPGSTAWSDGLNGERNLMDCWCGHSRRGQPVSISAFTANDGRQVPFFRVDTQNAFRERNAFGMNWPTNDAAFLITTISPSENKITSVAYDADQASYVTNGQWQVSAAPAALTQSTNYFRWFQ